MTESITAHETREMQVRAGSRPVDATSIRGTLEELADDERPLLLAVYGTKEDDRPGDFFMRECRALIVYKGCKYFALEEQREQEQRRVKAERERRRAEVRR